MLARTPKRLSPHLIEPAVERGLHYRPLGHLRAFRPRELLAEEVTDHAEGSPDNVQRVAYEFADAGKLEQVDEAHHRFVEAVEALAHEEFFVITCIEVS